MIKLCLTCAITVLAIAFAVIPMTSCGHRLAENEGANLAAPALDNASDEQLLAGHDSDPDTAHEAGAEHVMHSTLVELHHFNVYKNFRAMLDASSNARGSAKHRDAPGQAATSGDATYFACSGDSLIKQGD